MARDDPKNQRFFREEVPPHLLFVAVPENLSSHPSAKGSRPHSPEANGYGIVKPNDRIDPRPYGWPNHRIVAVDDPTVTRNRFVDVAQKLFTSRLPPVFAMLKGVQLDEIKIELCRKCLRQGRLAAARAADDVDSFSKFHTAALVCPYRAPFLNDARNPGRCPGLQIRVGPSA